jgi:hypothetical protein
MLTIVDRYICDLHGCPGSAASGLRAPDGERVEMDFPTRNSGRYRFDQYEVSYWVFQTATNVTITPTGHEDVWLGDLVARYGPPCSVIITPDSVNLQYADFFAVIRATYDLTHATTLNRTAWLYAPVASVQFHETAVPCNLRLTYPGTSNIVTAWHGFQTTAFYVDRRR